MDEDYLLQINRHIFPWKYCGVLYQVERNIMRAKILLGHHIYFLLKNFVTMPMHFILSLRLLILFSTFVEREKKEEFLKSEIKSILHKVTMKTFFRIVSMGETDACKRTVHILCTTWESSLFLALVSTIVVKLRKNCLARSVSSELTMGRGKIVAYPVPFLNIFFFLRLKSNEW